MDLKRKIDFALNLLQSIPQDGPVELSYSGGKDSDVCLELARMSGIKFEAIYKNTTIDPPGTIGHCRENGVTILQPKESFLHIVERKGFPSRFTRFCCEILKEYKVYDRAIQGVRRSESTARAKRYKEPELCRVYKKGEKTRIYLPILEWTDADVEQFIKDRGIKCAPVYYDSQGRFQVNRRLGCIGCPLANRGGRIEAYKKWPGMLRAQIKALQKFYDTHPDTVGCKLFHGSAADKFCSDLFFDKPSDFIEAQSGMFRMRDSKEFLTDYFKIDI